MGGSRAALHDGAFHPLHYTERLDIVNPSGDIGLITLWSPVRAARRAIAAASPELLDPARSRIAVIANLYGDGMYAMLCNLLFNPQVRHLIAIGEDLGLPTCAELDAFLTRGLEDADASGTSFRRIRGTGRVLPVGDRFEEQRLREQLSFGYLGKLSSGAFAPALMQRVRELPREHSRAAWPRVRVELDEPGTGERDPAPSNLFAHEVIRPRPLACWEELVVRVARFGRRVNVRSGARLELLNVKAVITAPGHDSARALARYGFELDRFLAYQETILRPELPEGVSYTYGNRLREHFQRGASALDTVHEVTERLRSNPHSRHAHISLWDNVLDLASNAGPGESAVAASGGDAPLDSASAGAGDAPLDSASAGAGDAPLDSATAGAGDAPLDSATADVADAHQGSPCLVTLFFRQVDDRLALTATYRAHNLLTAWLENVYGLMAIQRRVAADVGISPGELTVISQSLGIDPRSPRFGLAQRISAQWKRDEDRDADSGKYRLRVDPNGYFAISVDHARRCIVAEHRASGVLIKRYEGARADRLAREISADMAVSLVSHALWLGRELARNEAILRGQANGDAADAVSARQG